MPKTGKNLFNMKEKMSIIAEKTSIIFRKMSIIEMGVQHHTGLNQKETFRRGRNVTVFKKNNPFFDSFPFSRLQIFGEYTRPSNGSGSSKNPLIPGS